jgi:hypothetical protein
MSKYSEPEAMNYTERNSCRNKKIPTFFVGLVLNKCKTVTRSFFWVECYLTQAVIYLCINFLVVR